MTRGILSTIYTHPLDSVLPMNDSGQKQLTVVFKEFYSDEPFIRGTDAPPHTKQVAGSNMTQIHPTLDVRSGKIVVVTAIDNLVKGAAGQAIQNMNVMLDIKETQGLMGLALFP